MNNNTLRLIAQFTVRARKLIGTIDLKQFTENETYRESIFSQVDDKGDEELLIMTLSLREVLANPEESDQKEEDTTNAKDAAPKKYLFGARG
ncbi:MAG: hypothetical protein COB34_01815 [Methylophilaceae bacterium]|nr:MAG: hypothetical protein COB34_01815 [Methylophilaceae bacterium]